MSRWVTLVLVILLLAALMPLINDLLGTSPAFTTDNLLRGTVVSSYTP